jgi:Ni,Fe-hydrogenase I large subunit
VHALASTRAVDNAVGVKIPKNATIMRNLVMASQFLHDHLVHFYHLHALDWVNVANALKADPAKTAALSNSLSPNRKETAADFKAVQDKVGALVASGKLGIFTNAYFLGEKKNEAYYLPAEADLMATAHYLEDPARSGQGRARHGHLRRQEPAHPVHGCGRHHQLRRPQARAHRRVQGPDRRSHRLHQRLLHPRPVGRRRLLQGLEQDWRHHQLLQLRRVPDRRVQPGLPASCPRASS